MARLRASALSHLDDLSSRLYVTARSLDGPLSGLLKNVACALLEARSRERALSTLLVVDDLLTSLHAEGHLAPSTAAALKLATRAALEPDPDAPPAPGVQ